MLTRKEVAKQLSRSVVTVDRIRRRGLIPFTRIPARPAQILFHPDDVAKLEISLSARIRRARHSNQHSKLTPAQVLEIKARLAEGVARSQLADTYGVDYQTIKAIATRRNWAWLEAPQAA